MAQQTSAAEVHAAVSLGVVAGMEQGRAAQSVLADGIRALYAREELCDMALVACGERFLAHKAMLAAMSGNFRDFLRGLHSQGAGTEMAGEDPMSGLLRVVSSKASVVNQLAPEVAEPRADGAAGPARREEGGEEAKAGAAEETKLAAPPAQPRHLELEVVGVSTAESVRILLSYTYTVGTRAPWEYTASSPEVNKDVLRLSRHFCMQHLHEHAARWLASGLTTSNVVGRLVTCEEFGLGLLREKIIEKLTGNPAELMIVSRSEEITKYPRILQDLLLQVAMLCGMSGGGAGRGGAGAGGGANAAPAAEPQPNAGGGAGEGGAKDDKEKDTDRAAHKEKASQKGLPPAKKGRKGVAGA